MTSATRFHRLRRLADARAAWLSFGAVEVASIPLLLFWGRHWWFWADDWDFLASRTGGNIKDLFRSHYQHWTTLPVVAYRLLWLVFGLRSYVPYQLLVIAAHLTAAALLRVVMRRAGVRAWPATLVAAVFVFFGAGAENILIAFQITFVGSLVSLFVFRELPNLSELAGAALMIIGIVVLLRERHGHRHAHEAIFHEHLHVHDEHHHHQHDNLVTDPHSHPHLHAGLTHEHHHVSDVHHRHRH